MALCDSLLMQVSAWWKGSVDICQDADWAQPYFICWWNEFIIRRQPGLMGGERGRKGNNLLMCKRVALTVQWMWSPRKDCSMWKRHMFLVSHSTLVNVLLMPMHFFPLDIFISWGLPCWAVYCKYVSIPFLCLLTDLENLGLVVTTRCDISNAILTPG